MKEEGMTVIQHNCAFMEGPEPPLLSAPLLTADEAAELLRVRRSTV